MELKIKIGYNDILDLIRQLPASQIAKLISDIDSKLIDQKSKGDISILQNLLIEGPIMQEDQYEQFLNNREYFNKWRTI